MPHTNGPCIISEKLVKDAGAFGDSVTGRLNHSAMTPKAVKCWGRPRQPLRERKANADQSLQTARPTISPINYEQPGRKYRATPQARMIHQHAPECGIPAVGKTWQPCLEQVCSRNIGRGRVRGTYRCLDAFDMPGSVKGDLMVIMHLQQTFQHGLSFGPQCVSGAATRMRRIASVCVSVLTGRCLDGC